jgi:hypothetical protein
VFLKSYQALAEFQPEASLNTSLYRIATNTCLDYMKKPIFESPFGDYGEGEILVLLPRILTNLSSLLSVGFTGAIRK